jgi:[ribosomal protein S5]-alanine N-acetyltransferase
MRHSIPDLLTPRLMLRAFHDADVDFLLDLLNRASFIKGIADRQVRSLADAQNYLNIGPYASYAQHGHGLLCVVSRADGVRVGMAGILQRTDLPMPDLGYALLDEHQGKGYIAEAAAALLHDARTRLNMRQICAIANPDNEKSHQVLTRLGFVFHRTTQRADGGLLWLFARDLCA